MIDNFVKTMPLLEALSNPPVQSCHWHQIIELTGCEIYTDKDVFRLATCSTLGFLITRMMFTISAMQLRKKQKCYGDEGLHKIFIKLFEQLHKCHMALAS